MEERTCLFEESPGVVSMMRVVTFMLVVAGCVIGMGATAAIIFRDLGVDGGLQLLSFALTFTITGITAKSISKGQELKNQASWLEVPKKLK